MKKKMAIICSTDYKSYPMGGMMSFIVDILPGLQDDFDITLWGVTIDNKVSGHIDINGVSYPFRVFSTVQTTRKIIPNLIRVSFNIWKIKKEVLSYNYDILYIHGIPLSFPFFNQKKTKVVNHIHGLTNPFSMTANRMARNPLAINLYEKYRNWVVKKSDMILLASDKQGHQQFSSKHPEERKKIQYVPNFSDNNIFKIKKDARKALNIDIDETILVNTGRISLQKDPILLLESFVFFIKELNRNAKLVIIGDGELKKTIENLAKESGIEDRIFITGMLDRQEISLWLNAADLYVYTSHANGFPISLVESASCALPIVTTDVTGVHDLVINDETGYLINNREPEKIALGIVKALEKRTLFSKNIHSLSKEFTPEKITKRIKQMFNSL